jgi:hypothetical protein
MKSLVDLYSFTDMAANSGAPYNLNVDLRGSIASIGAKVNNGAYASDYAFQVDLMNMMNPLFDAHTLYRGPSGYQCFFLRPFNIEATVGSNSQMQYILRTGPLGPQTAAIWNSVFNFDISPYVDQVVTNINGMSPTDQVMLVAQNFISTYKDHGVRFNAALRGRWSQTLLSMFPLNDPNLDFVSEFTLSNGMTVSVPNAGFCGGGGIPNTTTLLQRNQFQLPFLSAAEIENIRKGQLLVQGVDVHREQEEMFGSALRDLGVSANRRDLAAASSSAPRVPQSVTVRDFRPIKRSLGKEFHNVDGLFVPTKSLPLNFDASFLKIVQSSSAGDTFFLKYNDGIHAPTWILKLTTFAPAKVDETLAIINAVIADGQANGGQNLIIDVAYNGGGIICLSDLLLALLVPSWGSLEPSTGPTLPYGLYDYRLSNSAKAIQKSSYLNSAFTSFTNYLEINSEKPYTNASFWDPIERTRGGLKSNYTQQGYFPAGCVGYPGGSFKVIPYYFNNRIVLTDGTCGSACALFASQLQSYNLAKIVSYGGPIGRTVPLSTASFAGGNVLEYNSVSLLAFLKGGNVPGLPPMMTSSAASRFNFNEYYEHIEMNIPREFLKRPADIHLDYYATFFNDNLATPAGVANTAALYQAVLAAL